MATWSYDERWDSTPASTDVKAGQSLDRHWEMRTDDPFVTSAHAIVALYDLTGVRKGTVHPSYPLAACVRISADRDNDDPLLFLVKATYQEPAPQPGQPLNPSGGQPKPEDRPPLLGITFRRVDEYRLTDLDDKPIENSAGDRLDDPPPVPTTAGALRVRRWYPPGGVTYAQLAALFNTTNDNGWQNFPRHSLLVAGLTVEPKTERSRAVLVADFELEFKPLPTDVRQRAEGQTGGWRPTAILDAGRSELVDVERGPDPDDPPVPLVEQAKKAAADDFGQAVRTPVKLDGNGYKLPPDAPPAYVFFNLVPEADFVLIGPAS